MHTSQTCVPDRTRRKVPVGTGSKIQSRRVRHILSHRLRISMVDYCIVTMQTAGSSRSPAMGAIYLHLPYTDKSLYSIWPADKWLQSSRIIKVNVSIPDRRLQKLISRQLFQTLKSEMSSFILIGLYSFLAVMVELLALWERKSVHVPDYFIYNR